MALLAQQFKLAHMMPRVKQYLTLGEHIDKLSKWGMLYVTASRFAYHEKRTRKVGANDAAHCTPDQTQAKGDLALLIVHPMHVHRFCVNAQPDDEIANFE